VGSASFAKESPLNAIILYDGANGPAYVQVTDLLIAGKAEVRGCTAGQRIDKSGYGRLAKVSLSEALSLERTADGLILTTKDSAPICVVPANLKFDKDAGYMPSELADKAILQGKTVAAPGGDPNLPVFKTGVKLVFVTAPDTELAEYLLAQRISSIAGWRDYLSRYENSSHAAAAREALVSLIGKDGEDHLAAYKQSSAGTTPTFADLKTAKERASQCAKLEQNSDPCSKLQKEVTVELTALNTQAQKNLAAYKDALSTHKPGYRHLTSAQSLVGHILEVDPLCEFGQTSDKQVQTEVQKIENSLRNADTLTKSHRIDDAYTAIVPYLAFAEEDPRVNAVIHAAYSYHLDLASQAQSAGKWQEAVKESERAVQISDTKEAESLLTQARAGLQTFQNRSAADNALAESRNFEDQKQYIESYEVLDNLPDGAKALVAERMLQVAPAYVKAASQRAIDLQKAHTPIKSRVDEKYIQQAYDYLEHASTLDQDDKNLRPRLDLLGGTISDYYFQQGRKYLEKPLGSGVGLGFLYLQLAQKYNPSREDINDERVKNADTYQMRSKLSVRVVFRDETSRRDNPLFAEQLSDAVTTGLETSGLPLKVVRSTDKIAAEPNFQLIGDVIQHRSVLNQSVESVPSKYHAGERELANQDWNKANRDYEAAMLSLQNAQQALAGAEAAGKKGPIKKAPANVTAAQAKVQEAHGNLDAIQKTTVNEVVRDYTYTKKNIDLTATVELAFRLVDMNGNALDTVPPIQSTTHQVFAVFENVNPEDTGGPRPQGVPPNELQLLTDMEIEARDTLIKAVKEKVASLPKRILAQAREKATEGDLDGAAESYVLFLNSTSDEQKAERDEARHFLLEHFNIRKPNLSFSY
jgi:hypothetical protein